MIDRREKTERLLWEHYQLYPELQLRDIFKFLHQSSYGCEHLVMDLDIVTEYISREAKENQTYSGDLTEPLDGDFCRVNLDWIKAGLSAETLGKLFVLSAISIENAKELLEEKLSVLREMISKGLLPFTKEEAEKGIEEWKAEGYPACRHSDTFRRNYFPAYRVIKKEYAMLLPLLREIDCLLKEGKVTLAIEGGSASGKTTLSRILEEIYEATVFHMDDFFLRPEQRIPERFAQPGGNIDWERFLEEVLLPLINNEVINYRCFDCSTFTLKEAVKKEPSKVNIIEGVYSMRPELEKYYDLSVFLDISSNLQEKRIRKRNIPKMAERFFNEWIPMEHQYFEKMQIRDRCDIVIEIGCAL